MARVGAGAPADQSAGPSAVRVTFPGLSAEAGPAMVVDAGPDGQLTVDGAEEGVSLRDSAPTRVRLTTPDGTRSAIVTPLADASRRAAGIERVEVLIEGWRFEIDLEPEARARLRERGTSARGATARGGPLELRAIIPGRVVSVDVAIGDTIDAGGRLLVVEAMKMQNELRSPRGGTISRLAVGAGQTVERGDLLLVIE